MKFVSFGQKNIPTVLFVCTVMFQLTIIKYLWGLEGLSRVLNIVVIVFLIVYVLFCFLTQKLNIKVWMVFCLPGALVFFGMLFNISINAFIDRSNLSYLGLTIPWLTYLAVPFFMKIDQYFDIRMWRYYYNFMFIAVVLALAESCFVFFLGGQSTLHLIETSGGVFSAGLFSIFFPLDSGELHLRMYGVFLEPGTLAMFLIPAIVYAYFKKKVVALIIMLVGVFATFSLGAFISLLLLPITIYLYTKKKLISFSSSFLIVLAVGGSFLIEDLEHQYDSKSGSKTVRIQNIEQGITQLPSIILNQPFGMNFDGLNNADLNSAHAFANFMPLNKLVFGGFFAFIGYLAVLAISIWFALISCRRKNLLIEEKVVFSSLLPLFLFVVQRFSLWESALFAFLYAPSIIRQIDRNDRKK